MAITLLTGVTPGNNLGCPGCGCGGDSCGADGCICCHQTCTDHWVDVKNATPAGFNDDNNEWWRKSTDPLSDGPVRPGKQHLEPLRTYAAVGRGADLEAQFVMPSLGDYAPDARVSLGYCWVEFVDKHGTVAHYYAPMQDPSKIRLAWLPDRGWAMVLNDPAAVWVQDESYEWRFVALKDGDKEVLTELTGTLEVAS